MERLFDNITLKGVLDEFYKICEIPHGSHNEEGICKYLIHRLESLGLSPICDEHLNICCDIPAAAGHEAAPLTVVQAHMDMVCAGADGACYNPQTDPVRPMVENGILCTDGTSSLGADNCIGISAMLHLIAANALESCGPIRVIFTSCEEKGMLGALSMSPAWIEGAKYLINTDGFILHDLLICSAGSADAILTADIQAAPPKNDCALSISLKGFSGGHSGYNAAEGRGNPITLLGRFLASMRDAADFEIAHIDGGTAPNALPCSCTAHLVVSSAEKAAFLNACDDFRAEIEIQYGKTSPNASFEISEIPIPAEVWERGLCNRLLDLFLLCFNGVESQNPYFPDVVGSSSNWGEIHTIGERTLDIRIKGRYLFQHSLKYLSDCHKTAAKLCGFTHTLAIDPSHIGNPDSALVKIALQAHEKECGCEANVTATHVGVEPSVFHEMKPELEIVTIGTDILNAHSPKESAPIESILHFTNILKAMLEMIAE